MMDPKIEYIRIERLSYAIPHDEREALRNELERFLIRELGPRMSHWGWNSFNRMWVLSSPAATMLKMRYG